MLSKFNESELEEGIIDLFQQENYAYVNGESIHRQYEDILLTDDLRAYLSNCYRSVWLSDTEMKRSSINSRLSIQHLYIFDLVRDDFSKIDLHIDYINYDEH